MRRGEEQSIAGTLLQGKRITVQTYRLHRQVLRVHPLNGSGLSWCNGCTHDSQLGGPGLNPRAGQMFGQCSLIPLLLLIAV